MRGLVHYHHGGMRWEADMVLEKKLRVEKELHLDPAGIRKWSRHWEYLELRRPQNLPPQ